MPGASASWCSTKRRSRSAGCRSARRRACCPTARRSRFLTRRPRRRRSRCPSDLKDALVYLALPAWRAGMPEFAVEASAQSVLARYVGVDRQVEDAVLGSQEAADMRVGRLNLRYMVEGDPRDAFCTMGLARVVERRSTGVVVLDESYIPPMLECAANHHLRDYLDEARNLVRHRSEALAGRLNQIQAEGRRRDLRVPDAADRQSLRSLAGAPGPARDAASRGAVHGAAAAGRRAGHLLGAPQAPRHRLSRLPSRRPARQLRAADGRHPRPADRGDQPERDQHPAAGARQGAVHRIDPRPRTGAHRVVHPGRQCADEQRGAAPAACRARSRSARPRRSATW